MPIAIKTDLANLALDLIGEPYLVTLYLHDNPGLADTPADVGTTADACRLHIDQCIETVLESHVWSFATRCIQPAAAPAYVTASLTTNLSGTNNDYVFTSKTPGTAGNDVIIDISTYGQPSNSSVRIAVNGSAITIYPGSSAISQSVVDSINANAAASALVSVALASGNNGTVSVPYMAPTNLAGGSPYQSAFLLPSDCLRLLKINGQDIDAPRQDFEIQGRYLLFAEVVNSSPVIHYITKNAPLTEYPTTFTDAVVFLLASRLASKITQDQRLTESLIQKHEMALGKARSKDARETRSGENHGPRQLAIRSPFVRARYGSTSPPF